MTGSIHFVVLWIGKIDNAPPNFRARRLEPGVGLGLSVAKGFVEAMGGNISATDTPGGGLTVVVDLAAPAGDRP